MGNMGFSKAVCQNALIDWNQPSSQLFFQCERTTYITDVLSVGITDYKVDGNALSVCSSSANDSDAKYADFNQDGFKMFVL